jgi:hypothetical protein
MDGLANINPQPDPRAIVTTCPVCYRTIWSWATCHHGQKSHPRDNGLHGIQVKPKPVPNLDERRKKGKHQ